MSNNDEGPKSDYESDKVSAEETTDDTQTGKPREKTTMFQKGFRSDLIFHKYEIEVAECRNRKDQSNSPNDITPRETSDLTFSAHDGRNNIKKSSSNKSLEKTSTYFINPINRKPFETTNNILNSLNIQETSVESNTINDMGIVYPPTFHRNEKQFDEVIIRLKSPNSKCSVKDKSNTSSYRSFSPGPSNSLPEENLECDSLGCTPDLDIESFPETRYVQTFQDTESIVGTKGKHTRCLQNQSLSEELLKSLHDGRCELTTDGPTTPTKMTDYITQQVIPVLKEQEEKAQRILNEFSNKQKENQLLKEKIKRLEQQLKLEHNDQIRMTPSQSQTQEADWEHINQFPEHFSIQVSEETEQDETNLKPYHTSQEIQQLREMNKKLSDANRHWEVHWDTLKRSQAAEIERLNQVIRTFHEQEAKRQEDIDKILLSAKRRQNDAEAAKEDALGQLAQITGQFEELKVQYDELKSHLVQRTKEKSDLETELINLKTKQISLSQTKSRKESKSSDKKLIQQLKTDVQVLQQQLKVFEEDFDVERRDRAKAQSEKEKLKEELELSRKENIKLTEKLRNMNGHQGQQQPKTQPETDPYAQPFTPTMMLPNYNNQRLPYAVNAHEQQQQAYGLWNCKFCTYVNHPQRVICEICGTQKGQGPTANRQSGSLMGFEQQRPFIPGDLCIDSGNWLN